MSREYEQDPEVLADLRLRAASEYDTSRTRGNPAAEWTAPDIVALWPCRMKGCTLKVPVTQDAFERKDVMDRQLARMGEEPLDIATIMACPQCIEKARYGPYKAHRQWEKLDRVAAAIRTIKASQDPKREHDAIAQLRKDHHPDVEGLLEAVCARLRGSNSKRDRKDSV